MSDILCRDNNIINSNSNCSKSDFTDRTMTSNNSSCRLLAGSCVDGTGSDWESSKMAAGGDVVDHMTTECLNNGMKKVKVDDNDVGIDGVCGKMSGKYTDPSTITPPESLSELISQLHDVFSGDEICVEYVQKLMTSYKSNPREWKKFAKFDKYKYTRNLVDEGNGKFNLMILCWNEAQGSSIHSHADSHCFLKVLDGAVKEELYYWPNEDTTTTTTTNTTTNNNNTATTSSSSSSCNNSSNNNNSNNNKYSRTAAEVNEDDVSDDVSTAGKSGNSVMQKKGDLQFGTNECTYINDSLGLHRVENESHFNKAVTLHLYSPPFQECSCFDQRSGRVTTAQMTFWSKFGKRTPFGKNPDQAEQPVEDN